MSFEAVLGNKEFEYMTVWYTKGIYVSFVNCFVVILPHHKNVLLLALTLIHYDCYSITGPTDIPLKVIIISVILGLPLSVRGVGPRT
jgi:hypothetical protein